MSDIVVGTDWHLFVGDKNWCMGILGYPLGDPRFGQRCGALRTGSIHESQQDDTKVNEKISAFDTQVGGSHYKDMAIQPTEYIVKNGLNFVEGNIIKYVTRYRIKGGLEDLKKAQHYLSILIELEEKTGIGT